MREHLSQSSDVRDDYELSVEWIAGRCATIEAQKRYEDASVRPQVLIVSGSSRSEHTCPGEMSKSFRLAGIAREEIEGAGLGVELPDLSRLDSEYGRNIHPARRASRRRLAVADMRIHRVR